MLERSGLKLTALIFFSVASFSAADPGASAVSAIFNTICSAQGNPQGNRSAKNSLREKQLQSIGRLRTRLEVKCDNLNL